MRWPRCLLISFLLLGLFPSFAAATPTAADLAVPVADPDTRLGVFSKDGQLIATAAETSVILWTSTGVLLRRLVDGETVARLNVALSGDGKRAATFTNDEDLALWDVDTGKVVGRFAVPAINLSITKLAVNDDGSRIAVSVGNTVLLFDATNNKQLYHSAKFGDLFGKPGFHEGHAIFVTDFLMPDSNYVQYLELDARTGSDVTPKAISANLAKLKADEVVIGTDDDDLAVLTLSHLISTGEGQPTYEFFQFDARTGKKLPLGQIEVPPETATSAEGVTFYQVGKEFFSLGRFIMGADEQPPSQYTHIGPDGVRIATDSGKMSMLGGTFDRVFVRSLGSRSLFAGSLRDDTWVKLTGVPINLLYGAEDGTFASYLTPDNKEQTTYTIHPLNVLDGSTLPTCSAVQHGTDRVSRPIALMEVRGALTWYQYSDQVQFDFACEDGRPIEAALIDRSSARDISVVPNVGILSAGRCQNCDPSKNWSDRWPMSLNGGFAGLALKREPFVPELYGPDGQVVRLPQEHTPFVLDPYHSDGSADGSRLLTVDGGNVATIFDTKTGAIIRELGTCTPAAINDALQLEGEQEYTARTREALAVRLKRDSILYTDDGYAPPNLDDLKLTEPQELRLACAVLDLNSLGSRAIAYATALTSDGKKAAIVGMDSRTAADNKSRSTINARLWDVETGELVLDLVEELASGTFYFINAAELSPDGTHLVIVYQTGEVQVVDVAAAKVARSFGTNLQSYQVTLDNEGRLTVFAEDGTAKSFDTNTGQVVTTAVASASKHIVMTRDGFFEATEGGGELLRLTIGRESLSAEDFAEALYRPDLVSALAAGDKDGLYAAAVAATNFSTVLEGGLAPEAKITSLVQDSKVPSKAHISLSVTANTGGIGKIVIDVGGIAAAVIEGPGKVKAGETLQFDEVVNLENGPNAVTATAFNSTDLLSAEPFTTTIEVVVPEKPPTLYVLAIGVNQYADSRLELKYAVPDARAFADTLQQAGQSLFASVEVTRLLDKDATTKHIDATIAELSNKVTVGDVFILYLAGHGITSDGTYYFIPADFNSAQVDSLSKFGIDQNHLQRWLAAIPARKSVLFLDTCESGSIAQLDFASRGMAEITAINRLNRAIGRSVISASTDTEPALEGYKGHGVFTYALMEAIYDGDRNSDGLVDVSELFQYVDARVPEISAQAFGSRQTPQIALEGTIFALGRPTLSSALSTDTTFIPKRPTHVTVSEQTLFRDADLTIPIGETMAPGVLVAVTRVVGGASEVAQDGAIIGFLPTSALIQLQ